MTTGEKRQAARIIRNARQPERRLFELIQELQDAMRDEEPYDWQSALDHLTNIQEDLPLLIALVKNIKREVQP